MHIVVNEKPQKVPATLTLYQLRERFCSTADIIIHNGAPTTKDYPLRDNDKVVFIRRDHQPDINEIHEVLNARHTPEVHTILKGATVGIAGVGGLGSAVAVALTRMGIGKLIIADYDCVELSNLNRQQYFIDQIGLTKVEALRANLARINPFTAINCVHRHLDNDNIAKIFTGIDVMVEAFDNAESKAMLAHLWLRQFPHIPLVAGSGMAGCGSSNTIQTKRTIGKMYICGDGISAEGEGFGLMASRVGIVAHHQANCVIQLLLGIAPDSEENHADNRQQSSC
ncbi:MAG: thiamine biosynthesis protein ThiF [Desulfobacteraceae bacterium 4572_35.1]|nr:MAG: thiamine biosynthesis protein ThiF [Desulfobacteraceae bacterium 4572_35.1]